MLLIIDIDWLKSILDFAFRFYFVVTLQIHGRSESESECLIDTYLKHPSGWQWKNAANVNGAIDNKILLSINWWWIFDYFYAKWSV